MHGGCRRQLHIINLRQMVRPLARTMLPPMRVPALPDLKPNDYRIIDAVYELQRHDVIVRANKLPVPGSYGYVCRRLRYMIELGVVTRDPVHRGYKIVQRSLVTSAA